MGCDTGPRDFRHDSGDAGGGGYDLTGGGGGGGGPGGHPSHFDTLPDTFHAEFITQVCRADWLVVTRKEVVENLTSMYITHMLCSKDDYVGFNT